MSETKEKLKNRCYVCGGKTQRILFCTKCLNLPSDKIVHAIKLLQDNKFKVVKENEIFEPLNPNIQDGKPTCNKCGKTLSSVLDVYYGSDPRMIHRCVKCRPA